MKRKRTRTEKFLLLSPLLALAAVAFLKVDTPWMCDALFCLNPWSNKSECRARREAGFGAVNCGGAVLFMKNDPALKKVDSCAIVNFRKGRAFRFRYDSMGIHGTHRHYQAWNPTRGVRSLLFATFNSWRFLEIIGMNKCNPAKIVMKYDSGAIDKFYHQTVGCL
jgi:hypothetical protein